MGQKVFRHSLGTWRTSVHSTRSQDQRVGRRSGGAERRCETRVGRDPYRHAAPLYIISMPFRFCTSNPTVFVHYMAKIFFAGRCPAPRWGSHPRPQNRLPWASPSSPSPRTPRRNPGFPWRVFRLRLARRPARARLNQRESASFSTAEPSPTGVSTGSRR